MEYYAGIDVSLESASLCVVNATGRIVREAKVASEPEILIGWFRDLGLAVTRIGLEAGPLSQWLYAGMRDAGLAVELLETRHVRDAFKAMPVKTDRKLRKVSPEAEAYFFHDVADGIKHFADVTGVKADKLPKPEEMEEIKEEERDLPSLKWLTGGTGVLPRVAQPALGYFLPPQQGGGGFIGTSASTSPAAGTTKLLG
jgi:hypothetical protein